MSPFNTDLLTAWRKAQSLGLTSYEKPCRKRHARDDDKSTILHDFLSLRHSLKHTHHYVRIYFFKEVAFARATH